jgi:hypothetical protein
MMTALPVTLLVAMVQVGVQGALDPETGNRSVPLRDEVTLSVATDRSSYYRGERLRLSLSARNVTDHDVWALLHLDPTTGGTQVFYRPPGATAFSRLRCFLDAAGEGSVAARRLAAGGEISHHVDLSLTALNRAAQELLLDRLGIYEFRVTYVDWGDDPNAVLESNTVAVEVVDAPAGERAAQAAYTTDLAYLAQVTDASRTFVRPEGMIAAAAFVERFPHSRYVDPVRTGLLKWLDYRVRTQRASADERALLEKLRHEDDATPPGLRVEAAPSKLWPPNHKLVLVTTTLSVNDDQDPNPVVKLESITCGDGCDVTQDVAGAELGTDDREFELRSERKGAGTGRTYLITYAATDASGNRAQATTAVVVPHDRGEKR